MIAQNLLKTGILQLGLFVIAGETQPYRLRLEMLSAYPQVMQQIIYRGVQTIAAVQPFDRLVSHADCIPLASSLSLNTGASLVYSRGYGEAPVHDLVGAYDMGHPACLIVNTITDDTLSFITQAHTVGLDIHTVIEVVATGKYLTGVDQHHIFSLAELIHELRQSNKITEHLASSILDH